MNHLGSWERWEKWGGMWWNQWTKILSPPFSSQSDPHPAVQLNRHTRFKISANQSRPSLLALALRSAPVPLYSRATRLGRPCHRCFVQRIISCCLFFEKVLSCETQGKHSNTNWHLILQAPYRCQLCSQRGGSGVCCVGGGGGQGGLPDRKWSLAERGENQTGDSSKYWVAFNLSPSRFFFFYCELASSGLGLEGLKWHEWLVIYTQRIIVFQINEFPRQSPLLLTATVNVMFFYPTGSTL